MDRARAAAHGGQNERVVHPELRRAGGRESSGLGTRRRAGGRRRPHADRSGLLPHLDKAGGLSVRHSRPPHLASPPPPRLATPYSLNMHCKRRAGQMTPTQQIVLVPCSGDGVKRSFHLKGSSLLRLFRLKNLKSKCPIFVVYLTLGAVHK